MREGWSLELGGFPPQKPKGRGRPPIKGKPHKKLSALIKDRKVSWKRYRVNLWYGRTNCLVDIASGTALWYRSGVPPVPIRWLLVRDPKGELEPQAFLATNLNARPCDILAWFVSRWQVEVTFAEGDPSHHAGPAWIILNRHPLGTRPRQITKVQAENHCMVSKSGPDLQRRDRGRAPRNLAQSDFFHVPAEPRQYKNSAPYLEPNGKCPGSRRMNKPKSS